MAMTQIRENPVTGKAGFCVATARASTGIYLALCGGKFNPGAEVVVPANLCYAGIYPVVYAGLKPVFCDVDPDSGNVTLETFSGACNNDTVAAIIPHMYGNPVEELREIAQFCQDMNIVLIEDCASAMGATSSCYSLGNIGDYVVYSTGYSKTLDLGFGGFLYSKYRDLTFVEELEQTLPSHTFENDQNTAFFSKLYRFLRNNGTGTSIEAMIYGGLADACRNDFLHQIDEKKKKWLFCQLSGLPEVIRARRQSLKDYESRLAEVIRCRYPYAQGAVPWRFNILVDSNRRKELISACLEDGLPVSDWYPRVTPLFGEKHDLPGARLHEDRIINFPLLLEEEKKERICDLLRKFAPLNDWGGVLGKD